MKSINKIKKRQMHNSKIAFRIIEIIHDNPVMAIFRNPYKMLKSFGHGQFQLLFREQSNRI